MGARISISSPATGLLPFAVVASTEEERHTGQHHDRGGQRRGDRAGEDVPVFDVGELVREHAGQFLAVEDLEMPSVAATAAC